MSVEETDDQSYADRVIDAISEFAATLVGTQSMDAMLDGCAHIVVKYLGAAFARIWLLDEKEKVLVLRASAGLYTHLNGAHARVPVGQFKIGLIAQEKTAHLTNDVPSDPRVSDPEWAKKEGMVAFAGHPLLISGRLVGVVAMFSRQALGQNTLKLLKALSDLLATAIEQRLSESELRRSEGRTRAIVDTAPDGIMVVTAGGVVESANSSAHKLFRYGSGKIPGLAVTDLVDSLFGTNQDSQRDRMKTGERRLFGSAHETRGKRHDGTTFPAEISSSVLSLGQEHVFIVIVRDISVKKEAERRVTEFYSMVSHELRTPLTSIRASLGLLEGGVTGELSEDAQQLVEIARSESDRLVRLINDILDLRKIEAGRFDLRLVECDASGLVRNVLQGLEAVAEEGGIKFGVSIDEPISLKCDRDRITQVLNNLISNAIKFSSEGKSVVVQIEKSRRSGYVRFSVRDQGVGIPSDQMHKLFGKFQQLDSSDARRQGGTGLGLAITKAIVEEHGGRVGVESTVGVGSIFWFEIPQQGVVPSAWKVNQSANAPVVLLIEDDVKLARVIEKVVSIQGYRVMVASTVSDAESILRIQRPDVILLDILLPDGNGLELMQGIWAREETSDIPVVVLSALGPDAYSSPLLIDWIAKPFDEKHLRRALSTAMRTHPGDPVTVLVVEDDLPTLRQISLEIESLGVRCLTATGGKEALALLENCTPDLIVLDVGMPPPMDGFDVVEEIRRRKGKMPLIVYTGRELTSDDKERLSLGITRYLSKSGTTESEVLHTVIELLNGLLDQGA